MTSASQVLLQSFLEGPLLATDLPEAATFPFRKLSLPDPATELNPNQKLGHLCEDAFAALLDSSTDYELLAKNLQIQTDIHTTVGELDFLIRDLETGHLIHLELATKFYLAVEAKDGLTLPGPDARDNFFKKLKHLCNHQLKLTQQHPTALPEEYQNLSIVPKQLIYGCLFDHFLATRQTETEFINPDCRRGYWLNVEECADHFPRDTHFQIIPKHLWPVPLTLLKDLSLDPWTPNTPINRCLMLRIDDQPIPYFITPSDWPTFQQFNSPPTSGLQ